MRAPDGPAPGRAALRGVARRDGRRGAVARRGRLCAGRWRGRARARAGAASGGHAPGAARVGRTTGGGCRHREPVGGTARTGRRGDLCACGCRERRGRAEIDDRGADAFWCDSRRGAAGGRRRCARIRGEERGGFRGDAGAEGGGHDGLGRGAGGGGGEAGFLLRVRLDLGGGGGLWPRRLCGGEPLGGGLGAWSRERAWRDAGDLLAAVARRRPGFWSRARSGVFARERAALSGNAGGTGDVGTDTGGQRYACRGGGGCARC